MLLRASVSCRRGEQLLALAVAERLVAFVVECHLTSSIDEASGFVTAGSSRAARRRSPRSQSTRTGSRCLADDLRDAFDVETRDGAKQHDFSLVSRQPFEEPQSAVFAETLVEFGVDVGCGRDTGKCFAIGKVSARRACRLTSSTQQRRAMVRTQAWKEPSSSPMKESSPARPRPTRHWRCHRLRSLEQERTGSAGRLAGCFERVRRTRSRRRRSRGGARRGSPRSSQDQFRHKSGLGVTPQSRAPITR